MSSLRWLMNARGEPLRVFHGTTHSFDHFREDRIGSNFSFDSRGFFFSSCPKEAGLYAEGLGGAHIRVCHVQAASPLLITPERLSAEGMGGLIGPGGKEDPISLWDSFQSLFLEWADAGRHDAIVIEDPSLRDGGGEPRRLVVVFRPNQIRNALEVGSDRLAPLKSCPKPISSPPLLKSSRFWDWFSNSAVVDSHGQPMVVYHATRRGFDAFNVHGEGAHFGTADQANMRATGGAKRLLPVYLSITNPKRVRDSGGSWERKIQIAKSHGHDGMVYLNRYEGISLEAFEAAREKCNGVDLDRLSDAKFKQLIPSARDSYIAFRTDQITSALSNDLDPYVVIQGPSRSDGSQEHEPAFQSREAPSHAAAPPRPDEPSFG